MPENKYLAPQALGETLEDLRRHASTTFGAAALISLPVPFVAVYAAVRPTYFSTGVQTIVNTLAAWWVAYAIILATRDYAAGADPGVGDVVKQSRSGLVRYGLARILLGILLVLAAMVAAFAGLIALGFMAPGLMTGGQPTLEDIATVLVVLGPLVLLALLFVYLIWGLAPVASAIENRPAGESFGRSREVTKGHRKDFLVVLFLVWVATIIVQIVVEGPGRMVVQQPGAMDPMDFQNLSFDQLMDEALALPPPASPPAAVVVAVSTYMSLLILEVFIAGLVARFYLGLTGRNQPQAERSPEGVEGSADDGNQKAVPADRQPDE